MKFRARNLPRHSQFEYRPRYYDPDKERIEALKADYTKGDPAKQLKQQISQGFKRSGRNSQFSFRTERSQAAAQSNRRLLLIIIVMVFTIYFVLEMNLEGVLQAIKEI